MNKIKILYIVSTLERCGPTNQLYGIISNLDQNKFESRIFTLSAEKSSSKIDDFRKITKVIQLNLKWFSFYKKLKDQIFEFNPNIIHTQGIRSDCLVYFFAKKYQNHHIATLRNIPHKDYPMTYGRLLGGLMSWLHQNILSKIKNVVVVSNSVKNNIQNKVQHAKVIHNGVDTSIFQFSESSRQNQVQKKSIISVGLITHRKDPETILKAFQEINSNTDLNLYFLGTGHLLENLKIKYAHPQIHFLGDSTQVQKHLEEADLFVSASHAEGFPNTVLEALCSGVPCLLSDINEHKEIQSLIPEGCQLFPLKSEQVLAEKIKAHFKNELSNRKNLAQKAAELFAARNMSRQYQKEYEA